MYVCGVLRKGQESLCVSGGDDLLPAQRGIVMVQEDRKIKRQERNEKSPRRMAH